MCAYEFCLYARLLSLGITAMHHRNSSVYINSLNKCMNSAQYISSCMQFNLLYFTPGKGLSMNVFCLYSLINTHMYIILLVFWQTAWFSSEILDRKKSWLIWPFHPCLKNGYYTLVPLDVLWNTVFRILKAMKIKLWQTMKTNTMKN